MRIEHSVDVDAPPDVLWMVLMDVEAWPALTPSMTSVEKLEPGPLKVGSRVNIKQPRLPLTEWTVTELVDNERFTWETSSPGMKVSAIHEVSAPDVGQCVLTLAVDQSGPLGPLVGLLSRAMTRRYLGLEARGLKVRAETLA
jgi:uncharacterized membrane protein